MLKEYFQHDSMCMTCLLHLMPAQLPDHQQVATPLKHNKPVDGGVNRNGGLWCCVLNHTAAVVLAGCSGKSTQAPTQSASSRRHTSTQWACSAHPRECANAGIELSSTVALFVAVPLPLHIC
jgi:hypothetical protein